MLNNTFCSKNFTNNINLSLNHDIDEYFGHDDVIGIYFHWPFCISKCNYCSFNSFVMNPPSNMIDLFISKINFFAEYLKNKTVASIYFGGGTPSLMNPSDIEKLINETKKLTNNFVDNIEITLEANPETVDFEKMKNFKNAGINRISFGMQSFNDNILKILGRKNSRATNIKIINDATQIFERTSVDLIYAIPHQTKNEWKNQLNEALSICNQTNHFSLYELSIEPGTKFYELYQNFQPENFYELTKEIMLLHNFENYEVSNYSKNGDFSHHNMIYWMYHDFLGIGPGAHSRITLPKNSEFNFSHEPNLENVNQTSKHKKIAILEHNIVTEWCNFKPPLINELHDREISIEKLLMGFRTNHFIEVNFEIINKEKFQELITENFFEKKIFKLQNDEKTLYRSTEKGRNVLNNILIEIIL